jgi:hypothetical protein
MGTFGGTVVRPDLAIEVSTATLAAPGNATVGAHVTGAVNLTVAGAFTGVVVAERSFDAGSTYVPVWADGSGVPIQFTAPGSYTAYELEPGVLWRLRASALSAGTPVGRVSC